MNPERNIRSFSVVALLILISAAAAFQYFAGDNDIRPPSDSGQTDVLTSISKVSRNTRDDGFSPKEIVDAAIGFNTTDETISILQFPNNETLEISWRPLPIPSSRPQPPYSQHYNRLISEAEAGNAESAFSLWTILDLCNKYAYESKSDLNDALDILQQTHSIQTPEMDSPVRFESLESIDTWKMVLTRTHMDCGGITGDQKAERIEILKGAAEAKYPIAMLEYSKYVTEFDEGVALDMARWEAGDSQGLNDLARHYEETYLSGEVPENKILAYAYLYAFTRLADEQFSRDGVVQDPRYELVIARREQLAVALLPNEFDKAIAEAKRIIESNTNCCFDF